MFSRASVLFQVQALRIPSTTIFKVYCKALSILLLNCGCAKEHGGAVGWIGWSDCGGKADDKLNAKCKLVCKRIEHKSCIK